MMDAIYVIDTDPGDYDNLLIPVGDPLDDWWPRHGFGSSVQIGMALNGTRRADVWKPIRVERYRAGKRKHRGEAVDFHSCELGDIAVSERTLQAISPLVGDAFEALPLEVVDHPEQRYFILHVVKLVDCLDRERTQGHRMGDGYTEIRKWEFRSGTTEGHHLFRVPEQPLGPNLCSAEFKRLVESSGLVGLEFKSTDELILPPWLQPKKERQRADEGRQVPPPPGDKPAAPKRPRKSAAKEQ
jgi:hypothetical protein